MKKLFILALMVIFSCSKEENPAIIDQMFFPCYDEAKDGPIKPNEIGGMPENCHYQIISEEFNDNNNKWYTGNYTDGNFTIGSGTYNLKIKTNTNYYVWKSSVFEFNSDFEFKVKLKYTSKNLTDIISICWAGKDWQFYNFGISKNKTFTIRERLGQNIEWKTLKSGNFSQNIDLNDWVIITVRQYNKNLYFFVNGFYITNFASQSPKGPNIGFFVPPYSDTYIDFVELHSWLIR